MNVETASPPKSQGRFLGEEGVVHVPQMHEHVATRGALRTEMTHSGYITCHYVKRLLSDLDPMWLTLRLFPMPFVATGVTGVS